MCSILRKIASHLLSARQNYLTVTTLRKLTSAACPPKKGDCEEEEEEENQCFSIEEKSALVTGGAVGIGLSCVEELLRNGARGVTIADTNLEKGREAVCELASQFGKGKVIFVKTDVTKPRELEGAFEASMKKWKCLDIVINNAGILKDSEWERTIATNINGVIKGTLLAFEHMGKHRCKDGGAVINLSSILGLQGLYASPVYVGTKHFVIGFDRCVGSPYFFKKTGVRVMTVCPGVTDTVLISDSGSFGLKDLGNGEEIGALVFEELSKLTAQEVCVIGEGVIHMLKEGKNGSVWVGEASEFYEVELLEVKDYKEASQKKKKKKC